MNPNHRTESDSTTYHFTLDAERPTISLAEALGFVKGCDPIELEPLAAVVDPTAIDELVSGSAGAEVSFTFDELNVEVTSARDIYVTDPTPHTFIHDSIDDASNVLLETDSYEDEACVDLLSVVPCSEKELIGVLSAQSFSSRISAWEHFMNDSPAKTTVINVGGFTRSSASSSTSIVLHQQDVPVTNLPDATELTELEAMITERLSGTEESTMRHVFCFDSVSDLFLTVDRERAVQFLQAITKQMAATETLAHYHFDPEPFDEETVSRVRQLFDVDVKVDDSGNWRIN